MKAKIKVLIIDDEVEICYLLSNILQKKSIDVEYACSLAGARERLKFFIPTLIFLDNHLPDGLGVEFAGFLRNSLPDAKIVIITGQEIDNEGDSNDVPVVILKPFTSEEIYSVIEQIA